MASLRDLAPELTGIRGSMQLLGRVLILSQDLALAASVHELLVLAEEAFCSGQQQIRKTLWRMDDTPEGSDAGSITKGAVHCDWPALARTSGPAGDSSFRWGLEQVGGRVRDMYRVDGG
jgi:hypothetical protein